MPSPFGSFPFDAAGIDLFAHPLFINANRAPTTQDIENPGTRWQNSAVTPPVIYETTGAGLWTFGGNSLASTTTPGIVFLSTFAQLSTGTAPSVDYVPSANDVFTYVNSVAIAGAPDATTIVKGISFLATNADVVSPYATPLGANTVITPANIVTMFATPPPIGTGTPGAGAFTTLAYTTATGTAGGTWATGGTAISIAQDATNDAVNIATAGNRTVIIGNSSGATALSLNTGTGTLNLGTDATAHTVAIGNATGATAVTITSGTGSIALASTGTGDITLASTDTCLIDSAGVLELNSSAGAISIGNDVVNQTINIATGGARTTNIGDTTGTSGTVQRVGTAGYSLDGVTNSNYAIGASTTSGTITIGGTAQTGATAITLGSSSATSTVIIQGGAGASTTLIGGGTAGANTTSINNGTTGQNSTVNILSGAVTAGTHAVNIFTGAASGGTQTFNLFTSTNAGAINIGTGGTGIKTIKIGGTAANVIEIGNAQTTGSVAIGNALTSGTVTVGGTVGTGTITIGQATNLTGQIVSIQSGASIAGPNEVDILAGATPAANQTLNIMTGVGTAGTYQVNVLTGNSTGTTQSISLGTGSARTDITLGGTGANVIALANTQTTGSFAVGNAMTSGTITLGGTAGTGTIIIGQATNATGQIVSIASGTSNAGANTVNILNGTTPAANTSLNIMCGAGSAGTQAFKLLSTGATRAGTVNIADGAAAHAVVIGQVTSTIAINGPTTHTLASGAATALTVNTSAGTGTGVSVTSSAVTVPDYLSNVGGIKVTPTAVGAGATPQTCNNRHGQVIFSGVSIAAGANQAFVIQNSTITGAATQIMYSWSGCTLGSALSIQSIVNAAGQSTITMQNGTGASTSTANIQFNFWVIN